MLDMVELTEFRRKTRPVEILSLPYSYSDLNPVLSKDSIEYHYGKLAHGYAERYNKGEGDKDFNYAGAFLHNIFFSQFRKPQDSNTPNGPILTLIKRKYGWWRDFKQEFQKAAMDIQGSGWVYLSYIGDIKTITNHEVQDDILLLVDWWEHSYFLDYGPNKKEYLENIWKIMNWNHINTRWGKNL